MAESLEYSFDRQITADDLAPLFANESWSKQRTIDDITLMLETPQIMIGVWKDDILVAYARALTDYVYRAIIDDVIVDASLRGQGVGTKLLQLLMEKLEGIDAVFLRCAPSVAPFYEKLGFGDKPALCLDLLETS